MARSHIKVRWPKIMQDKGEVCIMASERQAMRIWPSSRSATYRALSVWVYQPADCCMFALAPGGCWL